MKHLIAASLLLSMSSAAGGQPVDVAVGDWSRLPAVEQRIEISPSNSLINLIEDVAETQTCNVSGVGPRQINLDVPFAMQFDGGGTVQRIVVRDISCPQLETAVGAAVLPMARAGAYRPSRGSGWHRGTFGLSIR